MPADRVVYNWAMPHDSKPKRTHSIFNTTNLAALCFFPMLTALALLVPGATIRPGELVSDDSFTTVQPAPAKTVPEQAEPASDTSPSLQEAIEACQELTGRTYKFLIAGATSRGFYWCELLDSNGGLVWSAADTRLSMVCLSRISLDDCKTNMRRSTGVSPPESKLPEHSPRCVDSCETSIA